MAAPDHAAYAAWGGAMPEERYRTALPAALSEVAAAIWPNTVTEAERPAYERAVFAAADLIDSPSLESERAGGVSAEYAEAPTIASVIRRELTGTGLLRRAI